VNSFDKAQQVNQSVIDKWPKTTSAMNAQLGIVKVHFAKDDSSNAGTAFDKAITDYKDISSMPQTVFMFAEGYWNKALAERNRVIASAQPTTLKTIISDKGKEHYTDTRNLMEKYLKSLPETEMAPEACMLSAESSRSLGEYDKAIANYQKFVDTWPTHRFAFHCQYCIGQIYQELARNGGMTRTEANALTKDAYEKVIAKYPDSGAAPGVRQWLAEYNKRIDQGDNR
jgi:outer membrane protein assembly factor BamD (BamD/ComL family)